MPTNKASNTNGKLRIIDKESVTAFLHICIYNLNLGIGFHPDTPFDDYINTDTRRRIFTDDEAEELDTTLAECFAVCKRLGIDIYGITKEIMQPLLDKI